MKILNKVKQKTIKRKTPNYHRLKLGLVESNMVIVKKTERHLWEKRGFVAVQNYPVFLYEHNPAEVIMLGIPQKLEKFGAHTLKGATVLKVSARNGSYGMGGPGFFGLCLKTTRGEAYWLDFAVWGADQYVLVDGQLLACHPRYKDYTTLGVEKLQTAIVKGKLVALQLSKHQLTLQIQKNDEQMCQLTWVRNSPSLAPMGNGTPRKNAYKKGIMNDVCLMTYDETVLIV